VIDWVLIGDLCHPDLGIVFFSIALTNRNTNPVAFPSSWQLSNPEFC